VLTGRVGSGEEVSDEEISEVLSAQDSLIVGSPDTYRTKPQKHADLGIRRPERIILAVDTDLFATSAHAALNWAGTPAPRESTQSLTCGYTCPGVPSGTWHR
jgi:hypothetical protein